MRRSIPRALRAALAPALVVLAACASSPPPAAASADSVAPSAMGRTQRQAPDLGSSEGRAKNAPRGAAEVDDDGPEVDPTRLEPLFGRSARPAFSRQTISEDECWQSVVYSGDAERDYAALVERCGKPTGAIEYTKPALGRLDHLRDKRDTLLVFLRGGLCYRFFGVGDATIPGLDIIIERNGSLQGEDKTRGPVAIIDADHAWCMDSDAEYRFQVEVGGEGYGHYVFGVWARRPT